jgi:hypothetical protein
LVTDRVAVVVWFKPPLMPLIVSVKSPDEGPLADVVTIRVELVVAGLGVKLEVAPGGVPVTLKLTGPLKPFAGVIVTV